MSAEAVFVPEDGRLAATGRFVATELARGPWDPNAQHGGAPAALLMRAFERLPAAGGLVLTRVTYELLRPAGLGELELSASVVRPGKRVQLLEGSISSTDGTALVRARALTVRRAETASPRPDDAGTLPPGPERGSRPAASGSRTASYMTSEAGPAGRFRHSWWLAGSHRRASNVDAAGGATSAETP